MLLGKELLGQYQQEINALCRRWLEEESKPGMIYFGRFTDEDILMAFGALRMYSGSWYLRNDVVIPEFRGRGLQRDLIVERLAYLKERTKVARVSVFPENTSSIRNIEATGFQFERKKKLNDGKTVLVYKFDW